MIRFTKLLIDLRQRRDQVRPLHLEALSLLYRTGVLECLREKGIPVIPGVGGDTQALATQAARSAGYNECLTDLIMFNELFLLDTENKLAGLDRFNGIQRAVDQGDLTQEEADAIRHGTESITELYSGYINPTKSDSTGSARNSSETKS